MHIYYINMSGNLAEDFFCVHAIAVMLFVKDWLKFMASHFLSVFYYQL